jgi:predicted nucleic acid-binding protein
MPPRFLDTNVLLRYFTRDDEARAGRALALLQRVERGEEQVVTSPMVLFETVFTLQRYYRVPRPRIRELLLPVLALRGLRVTPPKRVYRRGLDLYVAHPVSFADAFDAAYMEWRGAAEVYSWDEDFDRLPGTVRVEPAPDAPEPSPQGSQPP